MPVKLSGELVEEARNSAKLFHRSITGQIEHWASLGRALESRLPADAIAPLLEHSSGSLKIGDVARGNQREQVVAVLTQFLAQSPEATDHRWLAELGATGVPLYGTTDDHRGIVQRKVGDTDVSVEPQLSTGS